MPEYLVVGLGCFLGGGGTSGDVGTRIVKVSDASVLASSTAKDEIEWSVPGLAPTNLRGTQLDGADQMEIQVYNESASAAVVQGFAIVRPRNRT